MTTAPDGATCTASRSTSWVRRHQLLPRLPAAPTRPDTVMRKAIAGAVLAAAAVFGLSGCTDHSEHKLPPEPTLRMPLGTYAMKLVVNDYAHRS